MQIKSLAFWLFACKKKPGLSMGHTIPSRALGIQTHISVCTTCCCWCRICSSFDGDAFAAEYALLALCSRPVLEQQDAGMAFHRLRVAFNRSHSSGVTSPAQEQLRPPCAAANALCCEGAAQVPAAANVTAAPSAVATRPCICPLLSPASRRLLKSCKELVSNCDAIKRGK